MKRILGYVKDEQGIETLEWLAVGALVVAMAIAVYPGVLQAALVALVGDIAAALTGLI